MERKHGAPTNSSAKPMPLAPSLHTDMRINQDQSKEKSKGYIFGVCYTKGGSHHYLGFDEDCKSDKGVGKLSSGKRKRSRFSLTGSYGPEEVLGSQLEVGVLCDWLGQWLANTCGSLSP